MQQRTILLSIFLCIGLYGFSQVSDDFSDGDFTNDPAWSGDVSEFEVDGNMKLHLNASGAGTSYLSTSSNIVNTTTWEFYVEMGFNPSSANFAKVYLVADQPDLSGELNGYFVKIGDTPDEVSLYHQSGLTETKIIDGEDDVVDASSVNVRIKVIRDEFGVWELMRDESGGTDYTSEGTVSNLSITSGAYFGLYCEYTSTRSDKFYFDDFVVQKPLEIDTVIVHSETEITIAFDQLIKRSGAESEANFSIIDFSLYLLLSGHI